MRVFGTQSATQQFDAALAYAQAYARGSGNGATLVFRKRAAADGTALPGFELRAGTLAPMPVDANVTEAKLGAPPFTISLDGAGHASACPPGEDAVTLAFSDSRATAVRTIPCNAPQAGPPDPIATMP
jgi:hypothetical protein